MTARAERTHRGRGKWERAEEARGGERDASECSGARRASPAQVPPGGGPCALPFGIEILALDDRVKSARPGNCTSFWERSSLEGASAWGLHRGGHTSAQVQLSECLTPSIVRAGATRR